MFLLLLTSILPILALASVILAEFQLLWEILAQLGWNVFAENAGFFFFFKFTNVHLARDLTTLIRCIVKANFLRFGQK